MLRPLATCSLVCCLALFAQPAPAQHYWAMMRDGAIRTGQRLDGLDDPDRPVALDGKNLFDKAHALRTIRNVRQTPATCRNYLEMTNGDVLAGRIAGAVVGERALPLPDHLLVSDVPHTGSMLVRLDCVRRIVAGPQLQLTYTPGYLRLADGRELQCRSIRWEGSGLKALNDDAILAIDFEQIAELHLPQSQPWLPPYSAAAWLADDAPVVRSVTADGQAFTYPRRMVTTEFDKKLHGLRGTTLDIFITRPAWALGSLLIDRDAVAVQTWLEPGEVPLSLLPIVEQQQKGGVHHRPWQRNRSVHGGPLHSGEVVSELGLGMHAFTGLTFQLPARAKSFTTSVGLNRLAGSDGCVHCRIWRDDKDGSPLWERKYLRGSDGVQRAGPLDISGAKQLILEVDFAHEGRPQGTDPLDVRDWVDWLLPLVQCEPVHDDAELLAQAVPEIAGWSMAPEQLKQIKLIPYWMKRNDQWAMAFDVGRQPLILSRQVQVNLGNAWLTLRASTDSSRDVRMVSVQANGEKVASTMKGDVGTFSRGKFVERIYVLHGHAGETVNLEVIAVPHKKSREMGAVALDWLALQPLIHHLAPGGEPIPPDVPLTSLSPATATHDGKPLTLTPGKLTSGNALNIHAWEFADGIGVPAGSEITYQLDPSWRRFVALIGLADGRQSAGPYQILLDDQLHWSSEQEFARNDQGEQISVSIPQGHKTITLRILGKESGGAWAHAGFLK